MNFQTNGGQQVALTGCLIVKRHQHSQQTHRQRQTTKCRTKEYVNLVNDLLLSQEDKP